MKAAILTISDRRYQGTQEDASGPLLVERMQKDGWTIEDTSIVPDQKLEIVRKLVHWSDETNVNLIVTTGGTGAGPRDVTPEATRMATERPFPGIAEAMRAESVKHTPYAMLSRGEAGSRGQTLIINFPGSPKSIDQLWPVVQPVLDHACRLLAGEQDPHA